MGIFQISAGDYRRFRSVIVEIGSSETEHKLGKERNGGHLSQFSGYNLQLPDWLAGAGGFEPPHGGIKIHCLTTWRRPNSLFGKRRDEPSADSFWQRRSIGGVEL